MITMTLASFSKRFCAWHQLPAQAQLKLFTGKCYWEPTELVEVRDHSMTVANDNLKVGELCAMAENLLISTLVVVQFEIYIANEWLDPEIDLLSVRAMGKPSSNDELVDLIFQEAKNKINDLSFLVHDHTVALAYTKALDFMFGAHNIKSYSTQQQSADIQIQPDVKS